MSRDPEPGPTLARRLQAQLGAKIAVWLGLAVGICVPYFGLQRVSWLPLREVPVTPLDRWIGFDPAWIGVYLSIALLVPLAPLLATQRDELVRYAMGLALLCAGCFAAFLLFPVAGPRPGELPDQALYGWLVSTDRPTNAMPSLHAGLAVYSLLFAGRALRDAASPRARGWALAAGGAWVAVILLSTLATKQHWALDLPAGALLAWLAHRLAWRDAASV